ncbi:MAG: sulfur carrier protein ThiS [Myxococcota bacterium]|nr:sulfur carrier protein ThiS [Myxococcota bacterium]
MRLIVNGFEREVRDGATVADLLDESGEPPRHVIVEVNGIYLPCAEHAARLLGDGDRVEIILPAFGG